VNVVGPAVVARFSLFGLERTERERREEAAHDLAEDQLFLGDPTSCAPL
jgi:hypothetical protein